jgi:hypothetical protein
MSNPKGRPLKFTSPEVMQAAIDDYFTKCDDNHEPYTMSGLAYELDMDRRSLLNYSKKDDFLPTIKKARNRVEVSVEKLMLKSSGVVAGVIFNAKNNFDWRDKTEQDITSGGDKLGPVLVKFIGDDADHRNTDRV